MITYVVAESTIPSGWTALSANQPIIMTFTNSDAPDYMTANVGDVELTAYNIGGKYRFDFTDIVRNQFTYVESPTYVTEGYDDLLEHFIPVYRDSSLYIEISMPSTAQGGTTFVYTTYRFVNSKVDVVNGQWNKGMFTLRFLTEQTITKWKGFPMYLYFRNVKGNDTQIRLDSVVYSLGANPLPNMICGIALGDTTKVIDIPNGQTYNIVTKDAPDNPFFVRWLNAWGGWDYYMFNHNAVVTDTLSDVQSINIGRRDVYTSPLVEYSKTANRTMSVKSRFEIGSDFRALSFMPFSTKIQHYVAGEGKWETITIDEYENTWHPCEEEGALELTFVLPQQLGLSFAK